MIDELLKKYGLTRYKITKATGVTASTLQYANELESVSKLKVKTLITLAEAIGKTPGQILDELIELENSHS